MSVNVGSRERRRSANTAAATAVPTRAIAPMITVSPRTPTGLPTASLGVVLLADTYTSHPVAATGGLTLTIYRVIPTLGEWAKLASLTGIVFKDQLVLPDIGGGWGLYFHVSNLTDLGGGFYGRVFAMVAELP